MKTDCYKEREHLLFVMGPIQLANCFHFLFVGIYVYVALLDTVPNYLNGLLPVHTHLHPHGHKVRLRNLRAQSVL
jgi:hypothetical protein